VFYFLNGGKDELFGSSADWMDRNLHSRVETCFPVEDKKLRSRVLKELNYYLDDNMQAWELQSDGSYVRTSPGKQEPVSAQARLLEAMAKGD
jgi:polyphosphate kinase